ncbi:MAG: ABC transporter permease, partial [Candidatus Limnocylindrales bacterium]
LRNMRTGKARLAFSIAGVAVATLLLAFVLALYRGWNDGLGTYIDETRADVWVAPLGSEGFFTPGFIGTSFVTLVKQQEGVSEVHTLLYRPVKLKAGGEEFDSWVVGFTAGQPGGPVRMKEGSATPGLHEIVIDDVQARLADVGLGDNVDVGGNALKVVGISEGGNVVFAQIAFVSDAEAKAQFAKAIEEAHLPTIPASLEPGANVNLILVQTPPSQAAAVAARINKNVPAVNAFVTAEFSENSRRALKQAILPILAIILVLAFLVGTLVLGLTVYTSVLEKEREFGVLKAVGTPGPGLLRVVLEQALVCCVAGYVLGVLGALVAAWLVRIAVPQFVTSFYAADLAAVFLGTVGMSVLAALVPALRVMRVDTLSVFKA